MTPARERLLVVLAVLAVGGVLVLAATQTFATIRLGGLAAPVVVTGQQAAPALAPLGLVALAVAGALTIARPVARLVLGILLALLGAGVLALVVPSVLDPVAGSAGAITKATGLADLAVSRSAATATGWPVVAAVAGVLLVLLGVAVLVRSAAWSTGGRRFSRSAAAPGPTTDPIAEWDALTRGTDPTDSSGV